MITSWNRFRRDFWWNEVARSWISHQLTLDDVFVGKTSLKSSWFSKFLKKEGGDVLQDIRESGINFCECVCVVFGREQEERGEKWGSWIDLHENMRWCMGILWTIMRWHRKVNSSSWACLGPRMERKRWGLGLVCLSPFHGYVKWCLAPINYKCDFYDLLRLN